MPAPLRAFVDVIEAKACSQGTVMCAGQTETLRLRRLQTAG